MPKWARRMRVRRGASPAGWGPPLPVRGARRVVSSRWPPGDAPFAGPEPGGLDRGRGLVAAPALGQDHEARAPARRGQQRVEGRAGPALERGAGGGVPGGVQGAAHLQVVIERDGLGGDGEREQQQRTEGGPSRGDADYADCSFCSEMRMGRSLLRMTSRVMMHSFSAGSEGSSYITSSMTSSSTARRPRAPVPRFIASRAIAATASSVNLSRTFSSSKYFWYCLRIAFFGSRRMRTSAGSSRSCRVG